MSGHTPGPWEYSIADGIYQQGSGYRLAGLSYAGKAISQRITYEELEANARLIAAAPELLNACRAALAYDQAIRRRGFLDATERRTDGAAYAVGEDLDALYSDWQTKAREAVAKAAPEPVTK